MSEELKQALLESKESINNSSYSKLVDECIEKNNINVQDYFGDTLLTYVCGAVYKPELILLFLKNRINVNIQNNGGITALMYASFYERSLTVELFLEYGANPVLKDKHGNTAKSYARYNKIVKILEKAEQNYTEELQDDTIDAIEEEIRRVLKL